MSFIDEFSLYIQKKELDSLDPFLLDDSPNMFFSLFYSGNLFKNWEYVGWAISSLYKKFVKKTWIKKI